MVFMILYDYTGRLVVNLYFSCQGESNEICLIASRVDMLIMPMCDLKVIAC